MTGILKKMVDADILLFASPIYQFTITALFKKFNERLMPVLFRSKKSPFPQMRNNKKAGKKSIIFLSTGAPYPINVFLGMTKYARKMFGFFSKAFGCEKKFILQAGGVGSVKLQNNNLDKAFQLGMKAAAV
jgi:multimeric flavodoxin WrbA